MKKPFVLVVIFLIPLIFSSACEEEPKVLSISPCALMPPTNDRLIFSKNQIDFYYPTQPSEEIGVYAPVYLPNGAIVKEFVVYCTDNDDRDEASITAILGRNKHEDQSGDNLAAVSTRFLASSPERRVLIDDNIDFTQVDNRMYSYFLFLEIGRTGRDLKFHGAKIIYE